MGGKICGGWRVAAGEGGGCPPLVSILARRRRQGRYANGFLRREGRSLVLPRRDRPRGRIIFTEIKSKIRLALKCAPDRASPRIAGGSRRWSWKERGRERGRFKPRGGNSLLMQIREIHGRRWIVRVNQDPLARNG